MEKHLVNDSLGVKEYIHYGSIEFLELFRNRLPMRPNNTCMVTERLNCCMLRQAQGGINTLFYFIFEIELKGTAAKRSGDYGHFRL